MSHGVPASHLRLKRAYEPVSPDDGVRVLVDRLWPRGLRRADAAIDRWMKDIAPSTELRRWFGHDAERWLTFHWRYSRELLERTTAIDELRELARNGTVTLVFAAHDEEHNDAVVLRDVLLQTGNAKGPARAAERGTAHGREAVSSRHP